MIELIDKRQLRSKSFDLEVPGETKRKQVIQCANIIHVPDDVAKWEANDKSFNWLDCDCNIATDKTNFEIVNAWYTITISKTAISYTYTSKRGRSVTVSLMEIGGKLIGDLVLNIAPVVTGNKIEWVDVRPGLDFFLILRPARIDLFKRVKSVTAPHSWAWEVTEEKGDKAFIVTDVTTARDNENDSDSARDLLIQRQHKRVAEVSMNITTLLNTVSILNRKIEETVTTVTTIVDPGTHIKSQSAPGDIVYPVLVDQDITETITANADDGHEKDDSEWVVSGYGGSFDQTGEVATYLYHSGFHFQTVGVGQNDTIDANTLLRFTVRFEGGNSITKWYGDYQDDAPAFGSSDRPSQMTKTTASTQFDNPSDNSVTVNVVAIIQEIVDRTGWSSGQDLRLACFGTLNTGDYNYWSIYDYNQNPTGTDMQLEIYYTAAAPDGEAVNIVPLLVAQFRQRRVN